MFKQMLRILMVMAVVFGAHGAPYGLAATIALPKSGQTGCWDVNGNSIICATNPLATGQDGKLQKGTAWPTPRFIDNKQSDGLTSTGTVTDDLTGLIWLKDAGCFATVGGIAKGTSSATSTLTWPNALTWSNSLKNGDCTLVDGSVAGDWRLPSRKELQSLLDRQNATPALPTGHPFSGVQSNWYWSSSTSVNDVARSAGDVDMFVGNINGGLKNFSRYVWPVRAGQFGDSVISVLPAAKDFGAVAVSGSSSQTFTISNGGAASRLHVNAMVLSGTDAGQFALNVGNGTGGTCGSTTPIIAPGGNCTVSVTFSPGSTGAKSASLRVSGSDVNTPNVTIALSGTGGLSYIVSYNGNTNTGGTAPVDASSPYATGATVTVKTNSGTLTKTGFTFSSWNTAANGSGANYAPAATFAIAANTTLYAIWTAIPATTPAPTPAPPAPDPTPTPMIYISPLVDSFNTGSGRITLYSGQSISLANNGQSGTIINLPGVGSNAVTITIPGSGSTTITTDTSGTVLKIQQVTFGGQRVASFIVIQGSATFSAATAGQVLVATSGGCGITADSRDSRISASPTAITVTSGSVTLPVGFGVNSLLTGETIELNSDGTPGRIRLGNGSGSTGDNRILSITSLGQQAWIPVLNGTPSRFSDGRTLRDAIVSAIVKAVPGLSYTGERNDGSLRFRDTSGTIISTLPIGAIEINPSLPDGVTLEADGRIRIVTQGLVTRLAPAVGDLAGLVGSIGTVCPTCQTQLLENGRLSLQAGNVRYLFGGGWVLQSSPGSASGFDNLNGILRYTTATGERTLLYPALADRTTLTTLLQSADSRSNVVEQNNGTVIVTLGGVTYTLIPDYTTAPAPTNHANEQIWRENDGRLMLRNGDGSVQGFTLR
ncbi:MAG TPA: DUF1566 domain-containing protein [Desulfuromonadales bacterium]|nr:DUF1566 domain-containing protein [Desulfuromonadales bacterium]